MTCAGTPQKNIFSTLDSTKYEFIQVSDEKTEDKIIEDIKDADAVYLAGDDYFSQKILEGAPKLKLVAFGGIGYESYIDEKAATKLGIAITNTPEANSDSVAEFTMGLLFSLSRSIVQSNNDMKQKKRHRLVTSELSNKKVGIIGMGAIGYRIAKILKQGFAVDVSYTNRTRKDEVEQLLNIQYLEKTKLLEESDVVILAITENEKTWNTIASNEFEKMKNTALLINPARPKLVNPEALYLALKENKIAGCAMDGYYCEPDEDKYGLLSLDDTKFICSADIACRTTNAWDRTDNIAYQNLIDFFEKGTCQHLVNPEYLENKQ